MAKLRLEIVTAERTVYSGDVDSVVAPGADGELGILPRHAALVTLLQPGELRVMNGNEEIPMAISGGFMEVRPDKVIVLADTAERADEIDEARADAARQRASSLLADKARAGDLTAAVAELRRSQVRLKVARRRRPQQA